MIDIGNGFQLLTRAEWGATVSQGKPRTADITENWIHHTVTIAEDDFSYSSTSDVAADMKEIERIGKDRFGCFPYSFCVHPSLIIAEGAGWDFRGAHTEDHNNIAIGSSWIGNSDIDRITDEHIKAFAQIIIWGRKIGKLFSDIVYPTGGHRDTKQTACPGANLYSRINDIRTYANAPQTLGEEKLQSITQDPSGTFHEVMIGTDRAIYHRYHKSLAGLANQTPQENLGGTAYCVDSIWHGNNFTVTIKDKDGWPWYRTFDHASGKWGAWVKGSKAQMIH